jgi:hypothetical protein
MIEQSIITEKIKQSREVLAVKIKELRDSKREAVTERKLTTVFIFLGELLENYKTDAELKIKINEKIQSNEGAIIALCELLAKKHETDAVRMIKEITNENALYKSFLGVDGESNPGALELINDNEA